MIKKIIIELNQKNTYLLNKNGAIFEPESGRSPEKAK